MDPVLGPTLFKLAIPTLTVGAVLAVSRMKGVSWTDDLGFKAPAPKTILAWLAAWCLLILGEEFLIRTLGMTQAQPWPEYSLLIVALRILAIGIMGPLAEETVVRGLLLHKLGGTKLGPTGAMLVLAALWAAAHYKYGLGTVAMIAFDGVILGLARQKGGSLWIPISMHMLGNCISIGQSLGAW